MLPQLCGIKHMLNCPPGSHSSYGMAWHPQPTQLIGQARSLSQISSPCTLNSGNQMGQPSLHLRQPCWNGWHGSVAPKGSSQKKIKAYITHLQSGHVNAGLAFTACKSPLLQCIICGIKRYMGEHEQIPKLPITCDVLTHMLASPTHSSLLG